MVIGRRPAASFRSRAPARVPNVTVTAQEKENAENENNTT
jgi:hypothetical protein